jgi:hypothetical protein
MNLFQKLYHKDLKKAYHGFDGVVMDNKIGDIPDLQNYFEEMKKKLNTKTEVLISYHNPSWEIVLNLASWIGLRKRVGIQNWLDQEDLRNILELADFEVVSSKKRFFGITAITIAKSKKQITKSKHKEYSVSIIVPARNEEGNIGKIVSSIPKFNKRQEIIFVEGNSKDNTRHEIEKEIKKRHKKYITVKLYLQKGKGKADAVKLGFEKATGDILMIYDADRTVDAKDLTKFYKTLAQGKAKFANGSRLVYPMEQDAMRFLNKIGNKFFGTLFTWILGTRFKDTLCGTKAMFRSDFIKYKNDYRKYLTIDPFGDFALIFTAVKHKLKIVEIPIRYKERVYGSTNINRFYHGLLLFKMVWNAIVEFRI